MDRDSRHFDPGGESVANAVRAGKPQQRRVELIIRPANAASIAGP